MPIHVTTSTTQSLSNKTFVDRVSTTGTVFADSGNSNQWSSTYNTVYSTSGSWDYQGSDIKALTANWQNTYTTVSGNSARYDSVYTSLNTNSAKYDSTYTTVSTNSAYWDSTYNTVYTASGAWRQTLSFDENTALLSILSGNTVSLSALSSVGGGGGIGTETDPIFTTWAQGNSANYQSTYTTVSATSGRYITNVISNTQGALSCIRLGDTFTVNTGLTVSATPTFNGLLVSNSAITATGGLTINPAGVNNNALVVNSNGVARLYGGAQVSDYLLPPAIGDEALLPYSAIMKLDALSRNAAWLPDLGENVYNHVKSISGNLILGQLGITIDGAGNPISTGIKQYLRVPYNCTITSAEIVADTAGYITVDIYNGTYANYPPTGSITGSAKPKLEDQLKNKFTSLAGSGWTTTLTAGDYLGFEVIYAGVTPNIKKITLTLSTSR